MNWHLKCQNFLMLEKTYELICKVADVDEFSTIIVLTYEGRLLGG
jgi:hypothetical protein